MRVAIDCRIAAYTGGGTGVYVRRLVEAFARLALAAGGRQEDELLLLTAARRGQSLLPGLPPGLRRRSLLTPSHHRWEQALLPVELAFTRTDVLHSSDYIPPFHRSCRSVITVHDLAFLIYPELLTSASRAYFNRHIRRAVHSADRIIAVSQATRQDLTQRLDVPAEAIDVVYEGADPAMGPVTDAPALDSYRQRRGLPADYVLFVGTLEPRKNLPVLIRAFAQVKRQGYAGKLVLAGAPGWLCEDVYAEVERQALGQEVLFTGPVRRDELPLLYSGARLLAFPSLYEGFGLPLVEAMACGLPVVTANVSSLPEVAGGAALLVDPGDPEALAGAVWRLLDDATLAADLRARGLARAGCFSWDRAARETWDVYRKAAA
ncbi:MAG: glycosyltransferase family 4 protein [Chloroflexota bacterium]